MVSEGKLACAKDKLKSSTCRQDYYGIRNPGGEDPRLPWLRETVCWEGLMVQYGRDDSCRGGKS